MAACPDSRRKLRGEFFRRVGSLSQPTADDQQAGLAFGNIILASAFGIFVGFNRVHAWMPLSPISTAFAHAHLAAVGWAVIMVVGLSYRLIR
jgi:hypothetical protein